MISSFAHQHYERTMDAPLKQMGSQFLEICLAPIAPLFHQRANQIRLRTQHNRDFVATGSQCDACLFAAGQTESPGIQAGSPLAVDDKLKQNKTMTDFASHLDEASLHLKRSRDLKCYDGFTAAWDALVQMSLCRDGDSEGERMLSLLETVSDEEAHQVVNSDAVDGLLKLDPPLETIAFSPHEEMEQAEAAREREAISTNREGKPQEALEELCSLLRRIRNKRIHGFKRAGGARSESILCNSKRILLELGDQIYEHMATSRR